MESPAIAITFILILISWITYPTLKWITNGIQDMTQYPIPHETSESQTLLERINDLMERMDDLIIVNRLHFNEFRKDIISIQTTEMNEFRNRIHLLEDRMNSISSTVLKLNDTIQQMKQQDATCKSGYTTQ
jgi:predicted  nucleic acid-binding Zn-ribbon protein